MDHSAASPIFSLPVRSISLPSRPQPRTEKIEAEMNRLKGLEQSQVASSPADNLQELLSGLAGLYECVDGFIHSPQTQQALLRHRKLVEESLDWSVGFLDMCGSARDIILIMKQHVQDLQSAFRRRGRDSSIESHVNAYFCFRKQMKKDIAKSIRSLKKMETRISACQRHSYGHHPLVVEVLGEFNITTTSIFQTLFLFLSATDMKTKPCSWSLMSKLSSFRSLASQKSQKVVNEVACVDISLCKLHGALHRNGDDAKVLVQLVNDRLETLNAFILGFEARLDGLFRKLIQHRFSLLNLLTL